MDAEPSKEIELSVGETNSWLVSLDGSNSFKVTALWSDPRITFHKRHC